MHEFISFREYLLEENALNEMSIINFSKHLVNVPENIVNALYKAYKVMKATAFLAALIYIGFKFEAIRALFPFLAPLVDKAGALIAAATGPIALEQGKKMATWLVSLAPELVDWIGSGEVAALAKVGPSVPPQGGGIWSPGVYKGTGH